MGFLVKVIKPLFSIAFLIALLWVAQNLVKPKYASDVLEGNFTSEYYDETTKHDLIIVGDCEVYENIDPIYLWENYGITSYIRGNAQQLAWQSYYMLEDTLKYETPKAVIYNVQALTYDRPQHEEYNRMTLDGMRWSKTKWDAIKASMCGNEHMIEYIFPLLRYHSRITDLKREDFIYFNTRRKIAHNGYYMRVDVLPVSESDVADTSWIKGYKGNADEAVEEAEDEELEDPWEDIDDNDNIEDPWDDTDSEDLENPWEDIDDNDETPDDEQSFGHLPMEYLDKMRCLCEDNDIEFILIKAPSAAPVWYDSYNQQIESYAKDYNLTYINLYEHIDEMGIDYETDTYDGGLHMNLSGADKVSKYLGRRINEQFHLPDHRNESEYEKVYKEKIEFHESVKRAQVTELKTYGEVKSY